MTADGRGPVPWILAIDTGTSEIVVGAGEPDGTLIEVLAEPAGHRHGELLLATLDRLLARTGLERGGLRGIVVGTGPGAFTGLRVGLATAKTLAHGLAVPLVGIGTGVALIHAADLEAQGRGPDGPRPASHPEYVLLLPAGPRDRVILTPSASPRIMGDHGELDALDPASIVAVDLPNRAPADAVIRGAAAHRRLGASLLGLGAGRFQAGSVDDPELVVPEYVTLPRGVTAPVGKIEWSSDPRS